MRRARNMEMRQSKKTKTRRPRFHADDPAALLGVKNFVDMLLGDTNKVFFNVDDVAAVLHLCPSTVKHKATRAPEGSVWAQCTRGHWHRFQVGLMVALRGKFITRASAESRWDFAKIYLVKALPPERDKDKKADKPRRKNQKS